MKTKTPLAAIVASYDRHINSCSRTKTIANIAEHAGIPQASLWRVLNRKHGKVVKINVEALVKLEAYGFFKTIETQSKEVWVIQADVRHWDTAPEVFSTRQAALEWIRDVELRGIFEGEILASDDRGYYELDHESSGQILDYGESIVMWRKEVQI